jgi:hypothetical protein
MSRPLSGTELLVSRTVAGEGGLPLALPGVVLLVGGEAERDRFVPVSVPGFACVEGAGAPERGDDAASEDDRGPAVELEPPVSVLL